MSGKLGFFGGLGRIDVQGAADVEHVLWGECRGSELGRRDLKAVG